MFYGALLLKKNLDIREKRSILPRLSKMRADGDAGVAKEVEDSGETFKLRPEVFTGLCRCC